jgi:hypothetical protein
VGVGVGPEGEGVGPDLDADGEAVGGMGVDDGRVDGEAVDGEAVGPLPPQATPFNVKAVGLAFAPL